MYSPGQRIKQIPFEMFSPTPGKISQGGEISFDISSPKVVEEKKMVYEDS
jgi:hypothetical protein